MMSLQEDILDYGRRARLAARSLAQLSTTRKNDALLAMADEIIARTQVILAANEKDLVEARSSGLSEAMIDRLQLDRQRLGEMAGGVRQVAALPDRLASQGCLRRLRVPFVQVGQWRCSTLEETIKQQQNPRGNPAKMMRSDHY